jgi:hypothetical protein
MVGIKEQQNRVTASSPCLGSRSSKTRQQARWRWVGPRWSWASKWAAHRKRKKKEENEIGKFPHVKRNHGEKVKRIFVVLSKKIL